MTAAVVAEVAAVACDCTAAVPVAAERVDATVDIVAVDAVVAEAVDVTIAAKISFAFDSAAEFSSRECLPQRLARRQSALR